MQHTVESLRRQNYKVRVIHRVYDSETDKKLVNNRTLADDGNPSVTKIDVTTPDGKTVSGIAFRRKGDQYSRKIGVKIALGRAMKQLKS